MIGVHMGNGALLGLHQSLCAGKIGQKLLGGEIDDPPEARHQMRAAWPDPEK